jgi:hypothetical protein
MKQTLITLLTVALVGLGFGANAQTKSVSTDDTNAITAPKLTLEGTNSAVDSKDYNKVDLTLSSAGTSYGGHNEVGVDVSLSIDPFKQLPSLWVGVSQSLYWQPAFQGSTDVDADWVFDIYKEKLYLNPGWSIGDVYGANSYNLIRTGPEVELQYYVSDDVYLYGCVNYDLLTKDSHGGWQTDNRDNNGWRWSIGLGWEF